jgi:hypothetical protein
MPAARPEPAPHPLREEILTRSDRQSAQPGDGTPGKKHGDKLGDTLDKRAEAKPEAERAAPGDSPKAQGDKLAHAVDEAAARRDD